MSRVPSYLSHTGMKKKKEGSALTLAWREMLNTIQNPQFAPKLPNTKIRAIFSMTERPIKTQIIPTPAPFPRQVRSRPATPTFPRCTFGHPPPAHPTPVPTPRPPKHPLPYKRFSKDRTRPNRTATYPNRVGLNPNETYFQIRRKFREHSDRGLLLACLPARPPTKLSPTRIELKNPINTLPNQEKIPRNFQKTRAKILKRDLARLPASRESAPIPPIELTPPRVSLL